MILANFDLSFFISIPGMLITGGVLLLLIALIIFIATGSKKDKKSKEDKNVEAVASSDSSVVDNQVTTADLNVTPSTGPEVANVAAGPAVANPEIVSAPSMVQQSEPSISLENNNVQVSPALEVSSEPTVPANESVNPVVIETPNVVAPDVSNQTPSVSQDNITSVSSLVEQPKVEGPIINPSNVNDSSNVVTASLPTEVASAPAVTIVNEEPKPSIETQKSIYGGANPVIPKIDVEGDQHRPIYGGANPLENTQSIPIVDTASSENVVPNVKEESSTNSIETPIVSTPQVEMPTIEKSNDNVSIAVSNQDVVTPVVTESVPQVGQTSIAPKEEEIESLF